MSRPHYHQLGEPEQTFGTSSLALAATVLVIYLTTNWLTAGKSLLEIIWNALIYVLPTPLLLDSARREELRANDMLSQTHAAKGDAVRRMLGLGGNAILQSLPTAGEGLGLGGVGRRLSMVAGLRSVTSGVPAGLGNWDNSCYQNSVLQAFASLGSLTEWLQATEPPRENGMTTTNSALQEIIGNLQDPQNNGRHIWTPAKLKSMSSWQQQDAQEYFSKIMEELDKEARRAFVAKQDNHGLETISEKELMDQKQTSIYDEIKAAAVRNPLEGLVAQRVACTMCGYSEGYSMIPFNCLTVPLGSQHAYDLEDCLSEYTKSEEIEGVECRSCTLMQAAERLQKMLVNAPFEPEATELADALTASTKGGSLSLPPEIRAQISQRLQAIEKALDEDDFADKTLKQDCQISSKAYASSTKTREAIIGRAPQSLVIHINRSVFDEVTGMQRKNYANVQYSMMLDLRPWMLEAGSSPATYRLSAVIQHYGRHETGHYICYRKHRGILSLTKDAPDPNSQTLESQKEGWWRLSDEDVIPVTEDEALGQTGAFMLFYERIEESIPLPSGEDIAEAAAVPLPHLDALSREPSSTAVPSLITSSAQSVVSDSDTEYEHEHEPEAATGPAVSPAGKLPPQAPMLRTASPTHIKHGMGNLNQLSMMRV